MISSVIDIEERRCVLQSLSEDWYVDHDGSHASRPTQDAIDKACAAAERAIRSGLLVEYIDADANGGTCVTMRGAQEVEDTGVYIYASIYFSNGGRASAVSLEPWGPHLRAVDGCHVAEVLGEAGRASARRHAVAMTHELKVTKAQLAALWWAARRFKDHDAIMPRYGVLVRLVDLGLLRRNHTLTDAGMAYIKEHPDTIEQEAHRAWLVFSGRR